MIEMLRLPGVHAGVVGLGAPDPPGHNADLGAGPGSRAVEQGAATVALNDKQKLGEIMS